MKRLLSLLLTFLGLPVFAGSPLAVLQERFAAEQVEKKSLIITKEEAAKLSQQSRQPVSSGVVRAFVAKKASKVLGTAVLLVRRVRTKDMAALYLVDSNLKLHGIEILAFYEPPEYEPKEAWRQRLKGKELSEPLQIGSDVSNITGATLSAHEVVKGARLALALVTLKQEQLR